MLREALVSVSGGPEGIKAESREHMEYLKQKKAPVGSKNGNDSGGGVLKIQHLRSAKCYTRLSHVSFSRPTITVQGRNYFQLTNEEIKNNKRH